MSLLNLNLNQLLTCEIKRSRNRFTSPLGKWFGTSQQDLSMEGGLEHLKVLVNQNENLELNLCLLWLIKCLIQMDISMCFTK